MIQVHQTPKLLHKLYPSLTWKRKSDDDLYLTFDDGPNPDITPWVLSELKKVNAKATFFCVGDNIRKHEATTQQIVSEGHLLANHTFNHLSGWKTDDEPYLENIAQCEEWIRKHQTNSKPYFRPPYGRIKKKQIRKIQDHYEIVMWSHLSWDFDKRLDRDKSLKHLKKAKGGSILVFHDSEKSYSNLQVLLPEVLRFFADKQFNFNTLSVC